MAKSEAKAEVEKRVLEAEKVVVSNILYRWQKQYGMDYVIVVQNAPGMVYRKVGLTKGNEAIGLQQQVQNALEDIICRRQLWKDTQAPGPFVEAMEKLKAAFPDARESDLETAAMLFTDT